MTDTTADVFYSHSYSVSDPTKAWSSKASHFEAQTDIPKMFGGAENGFSPEDYYALALQNCFIATFKVVANKSKLVFEAISVDLELRLGKDENEVMVMRSASLKIKLIGCENKERGLRLLEKTSKNCMILNSVKTQIQFNFQLD